MSESNITIKVKAFGGLNIYLPGGRDEVSLNVARGSLVRDVLRRAGIPEEEIWLVSIDNQIVNPDREVEDGDEVTVFAPVGGG